MQLKRFLLDGNIIDKFLVNNSILEKLVRAHSKGIVEILTTHVEQDELEATKVGKPERGQALVTTHIELNATPVPTNGIVLGLSKFGGAAFSSAEDIEQYERLTSNPKDREDVLLVLTAKSQNATFVSEDKRIVVSACQSLGVELFNFQRFQEWCNQNLD